MASTFAVAGAGFALQWGLERLRLAKAGQTLDPVLTLCTFAMRVLPAYKNAKPATRGHVPLLDQERWWIPTWRALTGSSNNDLFYISENIKLLIIGWDAKKYPALVKIAKIVIDGFDLMRPGYAAKAVNAAPLLDSYSSLLRQWANSAAIPKLPPHETAESKQAEVDLMIAMIQKMHLVDQRAVQPIPDPIAPAAASPPASPAQAKKMPPAPAVPAAAQTVASTTTLLPAEERAIKRLEQLVAQYTLTPENPVATPSQLKVIEAIKNLWDEKELESFEVFLSNGGENTVAIEAHIAKQQKKYTTWLNSEEATKCFTEDPSAAKDQKT